MNTNTGYLLVFFDQDQPKHPGTAMRKWVEKSEFQTLQEDFFRQVELNEITYTITDRSFFQLDQLQTKSLVMVLIVKREEAA